MVLYNHKGEQVRSNIINSEYGYTGRDIPVMEPQPSVRNDTRVDYADVLSITTAWAAITEISETIASLPINMYRVNKTNGKHNEVRNHWLLDLLQNGNDLADGQMLRQTQTLHTVLLANSYSEIEYNMMYNVLNLYPLAPGVVTDVTVRTNEMGRLEKVFRLAHPARDGRTYVTENEIFHIANIGVSGIIGASPIELFGRAFNLNIQVERYGAKFFKNGRPLMTIKTPLHIYNDDAVMGKMKKSYVDANTGDRALGIAIVPADVDISQIQATPDEAQFNETRQTLVLDIARIFRIPASRLGYEGNSTYNNRQQDSVRYVRDCLGPICARIESAYKRRFLNAEDDRLIIKHDFEPLLEQEYSDKIDTLLKERQAGVITIDEYREATNRGAMTKQEMVETDMNEPQVDEGEQDNDEEE